MSATFFNNPIPNLLTPENVAGLLDVKVETLAVWRCTNRIDLPYVKIGNLVRYKPKDVMDYIERKTVYQNNPENSH